MPGVISDVQALADAPAISDAPAASGAPAHIAYQATRTRTKRRTASFALDVSILAALLAASSAPTPLYPLYQDQPYWPQALLSAPSGRWAASTPPSARPS
ncbi:hypothetical protein OHT57_46335 [Streptomyces sp. NBC_00285]|uniref:hypothetical protein n=1 Tax=Streptomyces sp. NBC_00285 TaxID=2975700 RepID=UPI002E29B6E9|nr:hypothetical protein [Streptomyces sp. NBC_00285]